MKIVKFLSVFSILLMSLPIVASAQNKVVVVPLQGDTASPSDTIFYPIVIPGKAEPENLVFLEDAIGKPIVWNKGWDTSIGHRVKMDPAVNINFLRLDPNIFGYLGIRFTPKDIKHWGEQRYFSPNAPQKIYSKAVILVDKGSTAQGGVFEWTYNRQGFVSFHNILRRDGHEHAWIAGWTNPQRGEKVWFFIMSDDERFSSNPLSFTWP